MGIFDAIAMAANGFRVVPTGPQGALDAALRLPPVGSSGSSAPLQPAAPAPALVPAPAPALVIVRSLSGSLRAQSDDIAARQGAAVVRDAYLKEIGQLFEASEGSPDLVSSFDAFVRSWQTLADNPDDPAGRQAVIGSGDRLAGTVRRLSQGVEKVAERLGSDVSAGVSELNQTLTDIHRENRGIVSQAALDRPTGEAEARRESLVARVVELTGASVFARENKGIALFTPGGQPLLDQRPTSFTTDAATPSGANSPVRAEGNITNGRLGALLNLAAGGSQRPDPLRSNPDPGSEVVRKLRSQLDAVATTMLGRSRPTQPTAFADAYDPVLPNANDQLANGFFVGSGRLTIELNQELADGSKTLKPGAAALVNASLKATTRKFAADGLAGSGSYSNLVGSIDQNWNRCAKVAAREAKVADAANIIMAAHRQSPAATIDLETEVTNLQTLQTALGSTNNIGHSLGELLDALDRLAA